MHRRRVFSTRVGINLLPEVLFLRLLLGEDALSARAIAAAVVNLEAILQVEDRAADEAGILGALRGEGLSGGDAALKEFNECRPDDVALHQQLVDGVIAFG